MFWGPGEWGSPKEAGLAGSVPGVGPWGRQAGASQDSVGLLDWKLLYMGREQMTLNDPPFYTCQGHPRSQGPHRRTLSKSLVAQRVLAIPKCLPPAQEGSRLPARHLREPGQSPPLAFSGWVPLPEGARASHVQIWVAKGPQESSGRNRERSSSCGRCSKEPCWTFALRKGQVHHATRSPSQPQPWALVWPLGLSVSSWVRG